MALLSIIAMKKKTSHKDFISELAYSRGYTRMRLHDTYILYMISNFSDSTNFVFNVKKSRM